MYYINCICKSDYRIEHNLNNVIRFDKLPKSEKEAHDYYSNPKNSVGRFLKCPHCGHIWDLNPIMPKPKEYQDIAILGLIL